MGAQVGGLIAIVDRGTSGSQSAFLDRLLHLCGRLDSEPRLWVRARCDAEGPPPGLEPHPRLIVPARWAGSVPGPVAVHRRSSELGADAGTTPTARFASVHDLAEVALAVATGADALLLAPIFAPRSKRGAGRGPALIEDVVAATSAPVFALGGITPERVAACLAAGAAGVAVLSPVSRPDVDPDRAIDEVLAALSA